MRIFNITILYLLFIWCQSSSAATTAQEFTSPPVLGSDFIANLKDNWLPQEPITRGLTFMAIAAGVGCANYYLNSSTVSLADSNYPDIVDWTCSYVFFNGLSEVVSSLKNNYLFHVFKKPTKKNSKIRVSDQQIKEFENKIDMFAVGVITSASGLALCFRPSITEINAWPTELPEVAIILIRGFGFCATCWGTYELNKLKYPRKGSIAPCNFDNFLAAISIVVNNIHISFMPQMSYDCFMKINSCIVSFEKTLSYEQAQFQCIEFILIELEKDNRIARIISLGAALVYVTPSFMHFIKQVSQNLYPAAPQFDDDEVASAAIIIGLEEAELAEYSPETMAHDANIFEDVFNRSQSDSEANIIKKEALRKISQREEKQYKRQKRPKEQRLNLALAEEAEPETKAITILSHLGPEKREKIIVKIEKIIEENKLKNNISRASYIKAINLLLHSGIVATQGKKPSGNQIFTVDGSFAAGLHPPHGQSRVEKGRMSILKIIYDALQASPSDV